jgi:hypothetical protein
MPAITFDAPSTGNVSSGQDALSITNTGGGRALVCDADGVNAVVGKSRTADAVHGRSRGGSGVAGVSTDNAGVFGQSSQSNGVLAVFASGQGANPTSPPVHNGIYATSIARDGHGVFGENLGGGIAIRGHSDRGNGVFGHSRTAEGVLGISRDDAGVSGISSRAEGVQGIGNTVGVRGEVATTDVDGVAGVYGRTLVASGLMTGPAGACGDSDHGTGVAGLSLAHVGVYGYCDGRAVASARPTSIGVFGQVNSEIGGSRPRPRFLTNVGVFGDGGNHGCGVYGRGGDSGGGDLSSFDMGLAGYFEGTVQISGELWKSGGGFRIDHPVDPAHKYLNHSFVESSERKNVYDGVVELDGRGEAIVEMPEWCDKVNGTFRYQLTPLGVPAPDLHVAEKLRGNRFKIAGGKPHIEVSWQVTGIRIDQWARRHSLVVEEKKTGKSRNLFLHPELHGKPRSKGLHATTLSPPKKARRPKRSRGGARQVRKILASVRATLPRGMRPSRANLTTSNRVKTR